MNAKKSFKRFWTMQKNTGGFTLVELIVVIAILAILAGVAIPAYSGYIQKADRAGDEQLLAAVNTAFVSACMTNGEDNIGRRDAEITMEAGVITECAPFNEDFFAFYEGGTFKVFTELAYDKNTGMFVEGAAVTFGDYILHVSKELAEAMKNNTFSDLLGAEMLTGRVDTVANIASYLVGFYDDNGDPSVFTKMIDQEYLDNLAATLDMDPTSMEFLMLVYTEDEDGDPILNGSFLANSLVLSAAQKTEGIDTNFLGTPGSAQSIRNALEKEETATEAMAQLALTYGMYTSYMKSQGLEDASQDLLDDETFTGMTAVLGTLEGEKPEGATMSFNEYLQSAQGKADLDAYMASMQIITDSANQDADATKEILTNGFTDPNLVAALNSLFGNTADE